MLLTREDKLPRFNMPFELGLFLGAEHFGAANKKIKKDVLVLVDKNPSHRRYQDCLSDLSGRDVTAHQNDPKNAIKIIRNWLSEYSDDTVPGPARIWDKYQQFSEDLPKICRGVGLSARNLEFKDYSIIVFHWVADNQESEP
jgi:hypothetical protein